MAVYELATMRIPFSGPLRLRPAGAHTTVKRISGHITVLIDISEDVEPVINEADKALGLPNVI